MFSALSWILGFYSNFAIAWVVVATDITFNKGLLKLAPAQPEYRRGMIYNVNPVGVVSFGLAAGLSISRLLRSAGGDAGAVLAADCAGRCLCHDPADGAPYPRALLY